MIIPGIVISTASPKPFWAWYLHSADEFGDKHAKCSQTFVDEASAWEVVGTIINWVSYTIGSSIGLHIVYTAHCARAPRGCHESAARGVRASLEWWARSGPGWLVVSGPGWLALRPPLEPASHPGHFAPPQASTSSTSSLTKPLLGRHNRYRYRYLYLGRHKRRWRWRRQWGWCRWRWPWRRQLRCPPQPSEPLL